MDVVIENNVLRNNAGDALEIRISPYSGPRVDIVIRDNPIENNLKDGIQIIAQFAAGTIETDRLFLIERNTIVNNGQAAIGLLDLGDSGEDFRGASLLEPIHVFNNTIIGHSHGISGGDNMVVVNNLFVDQVDIALKNVDGSSIAAYNGFWNNGMNSFESNVDVTSSVFADPLLDLDYQLTLGSPAIDAGTALFSWNGDLVLDIPPSEFVGSAPDLGRFEFQN